MQKRHFSAPMLPLEVDWNSDKGEYLSLEAMHKK
jgi:hypothetical protein